MPRIKRLTHAVARSNIAQVIACGMMLSSPLILWGLNIKVA